jgi:hypothetical protein
VVSVVKRDKSDVVVGFSLTGVVLPEAELGALAVAVDSDLVAAVWRIVNLVVVYPSVAVDVSNRRWDVLEADSGLASNCTDGAVRIDVVEVHPAVVERVSGVAIVVAMVDKGKG